MAERAPRVTWTTVESAEHAAIRRRRGVAPTVAIEKDLTGLAISGGGIRSATFALGVLEALKAKGRLEQFDYLSTVSGGGYIGSWLSAAGHRNPGWLTPATSWAASIDHLRRYSNYLSPKVGFFSADTWAMAAIWLRNALLTQVTLLVALAAVLVVPRLLFELFLHWPSAGLLRWASIAFFVTGAVGIAGNQWQNTRRKAVRFLSKDLWPIGLVGAAAALWAARALANATGFEPFQGGEVSYRAAVPIAALIIGAGFLLQPVVVTVIHIVWTWRYGAASAPKRVNYTQGWAQAMAVLPLVGAAALVAAVLWGESTGASGASDLTAFATFGDFVTGALRYWPFPLAIVGLSLWMFALCSVQRRGPVAWLVAAVAPAFAVLVFHALLSAMMVVLHGWAEHPASGAWRAFVWGPPMVAGAFGLAIVTLVGLLGRQSSDAVREWWSRLAAWLGIYSTAWMVVTVAAVYGPEVGRWAASGETWAKVSGGGGWLGAVLAGLFAGNSDATGKDTPKGTVDKALELLASAAPFLFIGGLLVGVAWAVDETVRALSAAGWSDLATVAHAHHGRFLTVSGWTLAGCTAALLLLASRVDINDFSLNAFYKNRLVRCYLGATRFVPGERTPQNFTGFDEHDDLPLAELCRDDLAPRVPLHLVNGTLNLGGSSDLALHTRHGASFTMSPLFCGSAYPSSPETGVTREIGFVETRVYAGSPTLGQVVAVSGAAASPNSGYHTSPVVAFLLTLFNVRLGWWFPNPHGPSTAEPSPWFSLRYLIAELFGGADDSSSFLMVSDGGHFENLGAYELVRRKCRLIVVSDGECDEAQTFEGLGTLVRMCEVDHGAQIAIDPSAITRDPTTRVSGASVARGEITYRDGSVGTLVYLKASRTKHDDTSVQQYAATHPAFPHEPTGDQFYGEDQFESYRRLGRRVGTDAVTLGHL
jgi:Patatin-like phospholipase